MSPSAPNGPSSLCEAGRRRRIHQGPALGALLYCCRLGPQKAHEALNCIVSGVYLTVRRREWSSGLKMKCLWKGGKEMARTFVVSNLKVWRTLPWEPNRHLLSYMLWKLQVPGRGGDNLFANAQTTQNE